jgi:tetratricopeptide (TPR) repeat protein
MSLEIHGPDSERTEQNDGRRLDSWKEIAAFFQRDTRTVRRWEQTRRLPVHRVPGRRGYVFAYVGELNLWLRSADASAAAEETQDVLTELDDLPGADEVALAPQVLPPPLPPPPVATWRNGVMYAAVGVGLMLAVVFAVGRHRKQEKAVAAAPIVTPSDLTESAKFTLRGRYYWDRRTEGGLQSALDAFTQAVVHDNNNAQAYAGLAETYDLLPEYGKMAQSDAFPRAIAASNRAISLDPSLAEAHRALAFALFYWNWDVNRALTEYRTALRLDPRDFETHHWLSTSLMTLGRGPESIAEIQRARELQPSSRSILADQAFIQFVFHQEPAESVATLREIERTDPDFVVAPRYLANIFFEQKNYEEFIAESARAATISHDANATAVMQEALTGLHQDGERGMLLRMRKVQEAQFAKGQISGYEVAKTCALLGDKAAAVHYLQADFATHNYMLLTVVTGNLAGEMKGYPAFLQLQAAIRERMNQQS